MTVIRSIACALPETEVTNADLDDRHPAWAMDLVARRSGIESRHVAASDETSFDLSLQACDELFKRPGIDAREIDAILYCTQDPDYPMPGNAHLLHAHLGLGDNVLAFDYRLACSGFVYGLSLADALMRSGTATRVLLVTAETPSKRIHPKDRATRVLFGDGAAVTYLSAGGTAGARVLACQLGTHGAGFKHCYVPAGGARTPSSEETRRERTDPSGNVRTADDIHMNGPRVWAFVNSVVPGHISTLLEKSSFTSDEIDLYVFHQASKMILDSLAKALSIPSEKVFTCMSETGNLSSASIPFALNAALAEGVIGRGDRVLICGFGAGISYGSAIVEY